MNEVKPSQTITTQSITKEYNGNIYTTGETWYSPNSKEKRGIIVGFNTEGVPIIELPCGDIDLLLNANWILLTKVTYYVYRKTANSELDITHCKVSGILHEFTLEE